MGRLFLLGLFVVVITYCQVQGATVDRDGYHPSPHGAAGGRSESRQPNIDWNARAQADLAKTLKVWPKWTSAKNVILFIGDGMGVSTLTAGRFFRAQKVTMDREENAALSWEDFPYSGLIKTYNTDQATPDSAGTATAFMCGVKARAGVIGVNQNVPKGDCASTAGNTVRSFLHYGQDAGKWAGVVTTTRITHATPASGYAHSANRDWESDSDIPEDQNSCVDIAAQLIRDPDNQALKVVLGGGRREFLPNDFPDPEYPTANGSRADGANLIDEWLDIKSQSGLPASAYQYVDRQSNFDAVDPAETQYLFGLFEPSHMAFEADRSEDRWGEPSLAEMVEKTLNIMQNSPDGYVLLVEGGRIDHGHHATNAYRALMDVVALQDAVETAVNMTSEDDTLIVLTADHSHTFTVGGYPKLDNDIMGIVVEPDDSVSLADDGKPYLTLTYANGPGYFSHRAGFNISEGLYGEPRKDLTGEDTTDKAFVQDAGIPLISESHGGEDVAVYASGPMSQLFVGQHEQNYIAHAIMYTACIGDNKEMCEAPIPPPDCLMAMAVGTGTGSTVVGNVFLLLSSLVMGFWLLIKGQ